MELKCVEQIHVDTSSCLNPCSGLFVTSFSKLETSRKNFMSAAKRHDYAQYKKITPHPAGYDGNNTYIWSIIWIIIINLQFKDYEWKNNLRLVRIFFDTPTINRVTKDQATKFFDKLSFIGGTMGLFAGFSIISGVEICYFAAKIVWNAIQKQKKVF